MRIKTNSMIPVPLGRARVTPGSRWAGYLVVFALVGAMAQSADAVQRWERTYGGSQVDDGQDVCVTSDGGYVVVAESHSFAPFYPSIWLLRLDSLGDTLWTRHYCLSESTSGWPRSIARTRDGGYVVGGTVEAPTRGSYSFYLLRTDSLGDSLWALVLPSRGCDMWEVKQTREGAYVVVGWVDRNDTAYGVYVVRVDSAGDTLWTRLNPTSYGGIAYGVEQTSDGGFIIAGENNDIHHSQGWLLRLDRKGNRVWEREYGPTIETGFYAVGVLPDGGFAAAGTCYDPGGATGADFYLVRTNGQGDTLWTRSLGTADDEWGNAMCLTDDGGFVITGEVGDLNGMSVSTMQVDSSGRLVWHKTFRPGYSYAVQQALDRGFVIVAGISDVYVIKTDEFGSAGVAESAGHSRPVEMQKGLTVSSSPGTQPKVAYFLNRTAHIRLNLYDALGKFVRSLDRGQRHSGRHELVIPCNLPAGTYLVRLECEGRASTGKLCIFGGGGR